jgi:DNA-binding MarR family transcriptional regulator
MPKPIYQPDSFHLRDSIGYLLKRTQRLMQERIEILFAEQGCTLQQWVVLMHLRDGLATTVADLCRDLHHDSGAMTRLIDQLESRNLLERRRNSEDRRVIELFITKDGNELLDQLIPTACGMLNSTLEGFSRDEVKVLQSSLRKILGRLEDLKQTSPEGTAKEKA